MSYRFKSRVVNLNGPWEQMNIERRNHRFLYVNIYMMISSIPNQSTANNMKLKHCLITGIINNKYYVILYFEYYFFFAIFCVKIKTVLNCCEKVSRLLVLSCNVSINESYMSFYIYPLSHYCL